MLFVLSWWPVGLALILLCWGVGAYNRMVRLRAAIVQAFDALAPVWWRRLTWVQDCAQAVESEAARRLAAARGQCSLALEQARKKPFQAPLVQSLAVAASTLDAVWGSLPEAEFQAIKSDTTGGLSWEAFQHQALPLQMTFNLQVEQYNRAIAQFPASVLARATRLRRAEPLPVVEQLA